ncbi:AAC(3) family N-acetyltransferase [Paenibacillus sp. FSL H8-0548]|uniref:aminoglycoside N(3)-acetyltransferase n=1 Tax=Paenibacillus sp. FSL H8-0548 TaxID=1920422 RepID=UPI00096CAB88|nr:AAC(3) family N-acetyltransferase [Paenibacillus sp. FSL H8-0548]OMF22519.1 AAC(3) family N-acetyltransferase [Paenibacillus sp. FSL H8-0548]
MEEIQGELLTKERLKSDFTKLGVTREMTVIMHSSMKAIGGFVVGGAAAVVLAIEECIGNQGTLVMPTHTSDLSDPANWRYPPVNKSWWDPIRAAMPAFAADLTPCNNMSVINECFRKQNGVVRSNHPQVSFAAWGSRKDTITADHSLAACLGERSPLARIYEADGWVLLLGVDHNKNTSLHLAEYRAEYKTKAELTNGAPILIDGERQWVNFQDIDFESDDFNELGEAFEQETALVRRGKVGGADAMLMPMKELVDFAVKWMEANRGS